MNEEAGTETRWRQDRVLGQGVAFLTPPEAAELLRLEADYFARNAPRIRYPEFRRQDLFVGSGVIEAGCKTVVGSRLKRSGMVWTVRGPNAISPFAAIA
jgi:hypothetical protein